MRSAWRTFDEGLARDVGLVCAAVAVVGASFGAITVSSGLPVWLPTLLSVVVFAGAAQFMFVGIIASGGGLLAALLPALLVNTRHIPFGFAIGEVLGSGWLRRIAGTHVLVDESVAFALAQDDPRRRRQAYWLSGLGLFVCWNIGVVLGTIGGTLLSDTDALGLDAAFPAVLLALVLPSLKDLRIRRAVLTGAAVSLVVAPFVPAGLAVLASLVGVLAGLERARPATREAATP